MPLGSLVEIAKQGTYAFWDARYAFRGVPRVVNDEPIRFPARWSRYYPRVYEPEKTAFLHAHLLRGDIAVDLGAHIGLFSLLMARCVGPTGRVIAFEPAQSTRAVLRRTVAMNDLVHVVQIRDEAVATRVGTVPFHETNDPCSNANSLVPSGRTTHSSVVRSTTLAAVLDGADRRVNVVKMDIEGAELDVLESSFDALAAHQPWLTVEVHPVELQELGRDPGDIFDVLRALRYHITTAGRTLHRADFQSDGCFEIQAERS